MSEHITLAADSSGARIDKFLSDNVDGLTRSHAAKLIDKGLVTVDGAVVKPKLKVREGTLVEIEIPQAEEARISAENIPLEVIYEDGCMLVVNKPQGMVVHPAAGNYSGTMVNALLYRCAASLSGINGEKRPGILHRIDKDTSGLLLVAKNDEAHISLAAQIKEHSLTRAYKALVHGNIKQYDGTICAPIGRHPTDRKKMTVTDKNSRAAITHYKVLERFNKYTFVECRLETGRTHQIRVHMSKNGHPIVGDKTYGVKNEEFNLNGQLLHAYKVGFIHPQSGEYMEFTAPLPQYYQHIIDILRKRG